MRMRRKANLDERLEACRKTGRLIILNCEDRNFQTSVIEKEYLNIKGLFGNDNPAVMEIGAGKGQFACELARRNPDINVLAVERTSNVIVDAACPFPKKSYAAHRLTHRNFLQIYKKLLAPGAEIHQKTDNRKFFEFSIEELSECGFTLKNISLDLHADGMEDNIVTEYEQRFSDMGMPIYRLEAYLKG